MFCIKNISKAGARDLHTMNVRYIQALAKRVHSVLIKPYQCWVNLSVLNMYTSNDYSN